MRRPKEFIFIAPILCGLAYAQPRPDQRPVEQVFKNIQSLKGIPVNQFMATMGFFSSSLGENCLYCHVEESGGSWDRYADDVPKKRVARTMIAMVATINKNFFAGRRVLTCYSCHRGNISPETTPDLVQLYAPPRTPEPDKFVKTPKMAPQVDAVLDKYIRSLGGAQKLAGITSFSAKGTYRAYAEEKRPLQLYAKSPNQRSVVLPGENGAAPTITTYDGREGWIAAPTTDRPLPFTELKEGDLDGARLDAMLFFPAQIKQILTQWRAGAPSTIDDRDVVMLQATTDGRYPINFYFDEDSGLLLRTVRYTDSPVGLAPTQMDYADYRDVAGVKMPFKMTVTWLSGKSVIELTELQPNAAVDAARFARPAVR